MKAVEAFEGAHGNLHRDENSALADIIGDAGRGNVFALLSTENPSLHRPLQDAIVRAAEIVLKLQRKSRAGKAK